MGKSAWTKAEPLDETRASEVLLLFIINYLGSSPGTQSLTNLSLYQEDNLIK